MKQILSLMLVVSLFIACSKESETTSSVQEILFETNPALLGDPVNIPEHELTVYPPMGWAPVDSALFRQIRKQLECMNSEEAFIRILPVRIFLNPDNHSMLSVSQVVSASDSLTLSRAMDYIEKHTRVDQGERKRIRSRFVKENILIEQLLVQDQLHVNFKLVFKDGTGRLVQCDYMTLRVAYANELKAIESSIGSIHINR